VDRGREMRLNTFTSSNPDIQTLQGGRINYSGKIYGKVIPICETERNAHGTMLWVVYCCKCRDMTEMLASAFHLGVCSKCRMKALNRSYDHYKKNIDKKNK